VHNIPMNNIHPREYLANDLLILGHIRLEKSLAFNSKGKVDIDASDIICAAAEKIFRIKQSVWYRKGDNL
jgi:hypothetical protein